MENNEITLEKIELVKDRTGVGYKEAKEALEMNEGSVVDAIIYIEDNINASSQGKVGAAAASVVENVKKLVKKGNVNKIVISKDGNTILNMPVNVGIIGTVLFPWAAIAATITAFGTRCRVELLMDDGRIVNVSDKAGGVFDTAVSKGGVVVDELKDTGGEIIGAVKERFGDKDKE